jgi:dual specificity MAP kinase phosphatase
LKTAIFFRYPAEIIPGKLYLGDWKHAQDAYGLEQLGITGVITIHQDPESISFG